MFPGIVSIMTSSNNDLVSKWTTKLSSIEELTRHWKSVSLQEIQQNILKTQSLHLSENKEKLTIGRKELGAKTRNFSSLSSELKLSEFGLLLKAYQIYIDDVTRCLGESDEAFTRLHNILQDMTDPYPILDKLVKEKSTILTFIEGYNDSERLRDIVTEREQELSELKNQEVTINILRNEIDEAKQRLSQTTEESEHQSHKEVSAVLGQWRQREMEMTREIHDMCRIKEAAEAEAKELGEQLSRLRLQISEMGHIHETEVSNLVMELEENSNKIKRLQRELDVNKANTYNNSTSVLSVGGTTNTNNSSNNNTADDIGKYNATYIKDEVTILVQQLKESKEEIDMLRLMCQQYVSDMDNIQSSRGVGNNNNNNNNNNKYTLDKSSQDGDISNDHQQEKYNTIMDDNNKMKREIIEKSNLIDDLKQQYDAVKTELIAKETELKTLKAHLQRMEKERLPLMSSVRGLERELRKYQEADVNSEDGKISNAMRNSTEKGNYSSSSLSNNNNNSNNDNSNSKINKKDNFCIETLLRNDGPGPYDVQNSVSSNIIGISEDLSLQTPNMSISNNNNLNNNNSKNNDNNNNNCDEAFFAVAAQRDRLRQRLLALEEATSAEIDTLRAKLKDTIEERDHLLRNELYTNNASVGGGILLPSEALYSIRIPGSNLNSKDKVVTTLDMIMGLLTRYVLSNIVLRRGFLVYIGLLHVFVVFDLFYQTSGFF